MAHFLNKNIYISKDDNLARMKKHLKTNKKQVWRGALLLADYIWTHPDEFSGKAVLELAAGTGITSIVVAQLAEQILCTGKN